MSCTKEGRREGEIERMLLLMNNERLWKGPHSALVV